MARRASAIVHAVEEIVQESLARVLAANESSVATPTVRDSTTRPLMSAGNDLSLEPVTPSTRSGDHGHQGKRKPSSSPEACRPFPAASILLHVTHCRSTRLADVTSLNLPLRLHRWHSWGVPHPWVAQAPLASSTTSISVEFRRLRPTESPFGRNERASGLATAAVTLWS